MPTHGSIEWVCDHWAKQTRDDARTKPSSTTRWGGHAQHSTRVFQEGRRLYSYGHHYLLAQLVEHKGRTIALINDRVYSVSTSNHRRVTWGAANRAGHTVVGINGAQWPVASDVRDYLDRARQHVEKALRRRVASYAGYDLSNAGRHLAKARELAALADLPNPAVTLPAKIEPMLVSLRGKAVRAMVAHGDTALRDALEQLH